MSNPFGAWGTQGGLAQYGLQNTSTAPGESVTGGYSMPSAGGGNGGVLPGSPASMGNYNPSASSGGTPSASSPAVGGYGLNGGGPDGGGHGTYNGRFALAEGGAIPGPGNETDANQPVDFGSALDMVQNALAFGRQKNGMPADMFSGAQSPSSGSVGGASGAATEPPDTSTASSFQDPMYSPTQETYASGGGVLDNPVKKPAGMSPGTYKGSPTLPMGPQTGLPSWIKKNDGDEDDQSTQNFAEGGAVQGDDGDEDDASPPAAGQSEQTGDQGVLPTSGTQPGSQQAAPQGQPQGGDPKRLVGYVMGADGVTPDVAMAMESRVDPQGTMDPSERKLMAIAQAGGPQQAWGLMQHYRQKFNAYNAFAKAAAQGGQHKPADLGASAKAANDAYSNVPDGTALTFQPTRGGMAVQVRQLANKQNKSQQSYAEGGPVDDEADDPEPDAGAIPTDVSAAQRQTPLPQPDPRGEAVGSGTANVKSSNDLSSDGTNPVRSFVLSIPQYLQFLTKQGQYDKVLDQGSDAVLDDVSKNAPANQGPLSAGTQDANTRQFLQKMQAQSARPLVPAPQQGGVPAPTSRAVPAADATPAIDPDIRRQADALYTPGSHQWREYLSAQLGQQSTNQNKLDVANATWNGRSAVQGMRNTGAQAVQGMRNEGALARNVNTNATKQNIATTTQQGVTDRARMNAINGQIKTWIANKSGITPDELAKRVAPLVAASGQDPREVVRNFFAGGQQQAPAPQPQKQPAQGGAQRKFYNGKWYTRGPNGEAVPE